VAFFAHDGSLVREEKRLRALPLGCCGLDGKLGLSLGLRFWRKCRVSFAADQQSEAVALAVSEGRSGWLAAFFATGAVLEDVKVGLLFRLGRWGSPIIGTKTYANALGLSTADFREAPFPVLTLDTFYRSSRSAL
jgi:hypothetical protein